MLPHLCKCVGVVERRSLALQVCNLLLQLKLLPPCVRDLCRVEVQSSQYGACKLEQAGRQRRTAWMVPSCRRRRWLQRHVSGSTAPAAMPSSSPSIS